MTNRFEWKTGVSVGIPYFSAERMREMKENGIETIELSEGELEFFENFSETSKEYFQIAKDNGVIIRSVHLPFSPFGVFAPASLDPENREKFIRYQGEIVRVAGERGAELVVVHPSGEPYKEENRAEHMKYSIESMSALNEIALKAGTKLAIENLPRTCMLRNCEEIRQMSEALPTAFFCYDSNHSLVDDNVDIIRAMGDRIINTHISDYDFINERHLFPGEGKNDWEAILKALEEVNYSGTWTYEIRAGHTVSASEYKKNHAEFVLGLK